MFYGAAFDEFNREWQGIASEEQTEPASHKEEQEIPPDYTKMSMHERVRQLPPPTEDTSQEFEAYKNRLLLSFLSICLSKHSIGISLLVLKISLPDNIA